MKTHNHEQLKNIPLSKRLHAYCWYLLFFYPATLPVIFFANGILADHLAKSWLFILVMATAPLSRMFRFWQSLLIGILPIVITMLGISYAHEVRDYSAIDKIHLFGTLMAIAYLFAVSEAARRMSTLITNVKVRTFL